MKPFLKINYLARNEGIQGTLPSNKFAYRLYTSLAWPAALEGMLIYLISSIDLMMVGSLGADAIAATGIMTQPRLIFLSISRSLGVSVTALVARRKGEGSTVDLNKCLKQSLLLICILSTVSLFFSLKYIEDILYFSGAQAGYMGMAVAYGKTVIIAGFFTSIAVVVNSAHIGVGNTKIVLWSNIAGNLVNMILNFFLIYGIGFFPRLGIVGAGIATLVGSITTFFITILSVCYRERELFILGKESWIFEKKTIQSLIKVGSNVFAENSFERVGMFLYSRMVAQLGTVAFATHHICMNLCDIFYCFGQGMSKASSALAGQKLGEKRKDLAVIYGKIGQRLGLMAAFIAFIIFFVGRRWLMMLYSRDLEVIALGADILIIVAICCFTQTQALIYSGVLRGAGDTRYIALYSLAIIAVFRPVLTWMLCFPLGFGLYGAWMALMLDQALRMFFASKRFYSKKWMAVEL
ncbi:MATE family efflux transporter [Clostridium aceticum]|uniref:MATE family efflux transporter n=1 Tax=Clostridium aceticum TaxID=84022 RepID=UPI0013791DAC|nr:MATE family efflux transporter [Clostridium aceticum]